MFGIKIWQRLKSGLSQRRAAQGLEMEGYSPNHLNGLFKLETKRSLKHLTLGVNGKSLPSYSFDIFVNFYFTPVHLIAILWVLKCLAGLSELMKVIFKSTEKGWMVAYMLTESCPTSKESHEQSLNYQHSSVEAESCKDRIVWCVQGHFPGRRWRVPIF